MLLTVCACLSSGKALLNGCFDVAASVGFMTILRVFGRNSCFVPKVVVVL